MTVQLSTGLLKNAELAAGEARDRGREEKECGNRKKDVVVVDRQAVASLWCNRACPYPSCDSAWISPRRLLRSPFDCGLFRGVASEGWPFPSRKISPQFPPCSEGGACWTDRGKAFLRPTPRHLGPCARPGHRFGACSSTQAGGVTEPQEVMTSSCVLLYRVPIDTSSFAPLLS